MSKDRSIYMYGKPNTKYGIYNTVAKSFQFGICEDTPMLAVARLHQKIGDSAKKWRFEPRPLPNKLVIHSVTSPDVVEVDLNRKDDNK